MLDLRVARSQLLALREDFLLLGAELFPVGEGLFFERQDEGFSASESSCSRSRGVASSIAREYIALFLQHD